MTSDFYTFYVPIFLFIFGNVKNDCFDLINGEAVYTGTTSITETGRVCQRWDSQVPHLHPYCCTKVASTDENYCRNPDSWDKTWCMTSDPAKEWEACAVPDCASTTSSDCFNLVNGVAIYNGTTSITVNGRVCQRWDSQVPHSHDYCCDKVTSADENYCRNPDQWNRTWCMTSDPGMTWEACAVPNCVDTTSTLTSTTTPTTTELTTDSTTTEPSTLTTTESTTVITYTESTTAFTTSDLTTVFTTTEPSTVSTTTEFTTVATTTEPSTFPTTTKSSYQPDAITTTSSLCQCPCTDRKQLWFTFYYGNLTDEEKRQILYQEQQRLRKELLVDTNYLSSYRRQKISADDQRTSAVSIGKVGVAILVVIFTLIVINDFINLCRQISNSCKNNYK